MEKEQQQPNNSDPTRPEEPTEEEMCNWIYTPSLQTYRTANLMIEHIKENDQFRNFAFHNINHIYQHRRDAGNLAEIQVTRHYSQWATKQFQENDQENDQATQQQTELILTLSKQAETPSAFALAAATAENKLQHFSRLQRDPRWTGFCPSLSKLAGLAATVYESKHFPNQPGIVLLLPPELQPKLEIQP